MRHHPPEDLVSLLESLRLATPDQVAAAERKARRLARGLPLFVSVWIDALLKLRLLTPFQAAEINANRGETLRVGPYVLFRKLTGLGFAEVHEARHLETGAFRRLATFCPPADQVVEITNRLERLVAASDALPREVIAPVEACGRDAERFWAACDAPRGRTAAEAMIYHGRFPAQSVLEIARRMMPGLVALEAAGLCHGDLRAATLLFDGDGSGKRFGLRLPLAGLRGAVRPQEGYARADLPPEALDGLSPERVRDGTPPEVASDVYACGCLWWHLLTGRDPLPGGDALTKLQAAEKGNIAEAKPLAPDTPEILLAAVRACTRATPEQRPGGMAELATMLGPATRHAAARTRRTLARHVGRAPRPSSGPRRAGRWMIAWLAVIAVCVAAIVVLVVGHHKRGATAGLPSSAENTVGQADRDTRRVDREDRRGDGTRHNGVAEARDPRPSVGAERATANPPVVVPTPSETRRQRHFVFGVDTQRGDLPIARLPLAPGQRVHGPSGERITLNVARGGLLVEVPGVVFENIDFVWGHPADVQRAERSPAILVLRSSSVELRGCTFRSADPSVDAVCWIHPVDPDLAELSLPSGRITVDRCVFRNLDTAIDCHARGALAIRCSNVLHLGAGPLVRLARAPGPDEPLNLSIARTTLRRSGPVMQCDATAAGPAGRISIETNGCVFAPRENQPLVALVGEPSSDALLKHIAWTGQGSLVSPNSPIVGRLDASGRSTVLPETVFSIEGLVRGEVEFAGEADGTAADSRAVRWLAPLRSDEAPGIDASVLPE